MSSVRSDTRLSFISENIVNMRKSEVKVAHYVLEHSDTVIHSSVSEIAENASVSEPTVIRFCRALGFKGYQDFKINLAQSIIPVLKSIHEAVDEHDGIPQVIRKVFNANIAAVTHSAEGLDQDAVAAAVQILAESTHISFFGLGGSASLAMDAHHKFFKIGIPCSWFNDAHMQAMSASLMKPGDTLVVISHSGSSKDIVESLRIASEAGASTIAIVSQVKSPVSNAAGINLCVHSSESNYRFEPMSSRIAQLCVIDVLSVGVSLRRQEQVVQSLSKTRKALVDKRY
ncbi:MAG: MurR/RpiR family transcriptional regulator [Spirochaetaceae bacterium]|nr:MAG: MurR/RpiR family transcriptional regulator [Spirochaetaceae bacterium]